MNKQELLEYLKELELDNKRCSQEAKDEVSRRDFDHIAFGVWLAIDAIENNLKEDEVKC